MTGEGASDTGPGGPAQPGPAFSETALSGRVVMAIGCGTPDGRVNNGFAAAKAYLAAGASVCIVDRDPMALTRALEALGADSAGDGRWRTNHLGEGAGDGDSTMPGAVTTATADVTDEDALRAAFDQCAATLGPPTVLHHNVGIVINGGLDTLPTSAFTTALDVNLTGAFRAFKLALPFMRAAGSGAIITVASVGGLRHMGYDYPAYAASKAGLIELTKATGLQYAGEGIRANVIAPGLIETPLIHAAISGHYTSAEEMLASRHALSPTGRMGRPEDLAALAVFLASPASA